MAQWLYRIVPTRAEMLDHPTEREQVLVGEHFDYLQQLLAAGHLILAGRTQETDTFGLVIFEADDEAAAHAVVQGDPAVNQGVFTATLHSYAVALSRGGTIAAGNTS